MSHKSMAHSWKCRFYWALYTGSELFLCCQFLSFFSSHLSLSLSPFNVAPLMKSGGSVIFSIVPRVSLFPNSSRSSQNSAGPTDRNSLPCRYQSPPLLTIILICLSLFVFTPWAPVSPAHFKKTRFHCDCYWQPNLRFICTGFSITTFCKKLEYVPHWWKKCSDP